MAEADIMTCDEARLGMDRLQSLAVDVQHHVDHCETCRQYVTEVSGLRAALSTTPPAPDMLRRAHAKIRRTNFDKRLVPVVSLVAGLAIGVVVSLLWLMTTDNRTESLPEVVATVSERLVDRLHLVTEFTADVTITERNWHQDVPERTYTGSVRISGADRFQLVLSDLTQYPDRAWVGNNLLFSTDGRQTTLRSTASCTPMLLPGCARQPETRTTTNSIPFQSDLPALDEIAIPLRTWASSPSATFPDEGRPVAEAIGIEVSAVQAKKLLDVFVSRGSWRDIYPADRVVVWLDPKDLTPVQILVRALDSPARSAWAASREYEDSPLQPYLEIELTKLTDPRGDTSMTAGSVVDGRFVDGQPATDELVGFAPHRSGTISGIDGWTVQTWTRGLAWIRVDTFMGWNAARFPGEAIAKIPITDDFGTGYLDIDGSALHVHGQTSDVIISSNAGTDVMLDVASELKLSGIEAPVDWASFSSVSEARASGVAIPDIDLVDPDRTAVHTRSDGFDLVGWIGGAAFIEWTKVTGDRLRPPSGASTTGVVVDDIIARYTPELGRLEWVSGGSINTLTITGFDLTQLGEMLRELEGR